MSEIAATYEKLRTEYLVKTPLAGRYGKSWQRVMGSAMDVELDRCRWARRARWPEYCPSDGLYYLGVERGLERVVTVGTLAPEDEGEYRRRLRGAWGIWVVAGSQRIHQLSLGWTGLRNVSVHRRKEWNMPSDDPGLSPYVRAFQRAVWSQFDILVERPHPWEPAFWGDGRLWGGGWTWGSTATVAEVEQTRRLLRTFAAGHDTPMWVWLSFGGGRLWGSGWTWGDGGSWGAGPGGVLRWLVGEEHWKLRGLVP